MIRIVFAADSEDCQAVSQVQAERYPKQGSHDSDRFYFEGLPGLLALTSDALPVTVVIGATKLVVHVIRL